jgi:hypothetical protein
VPVPNTNLVGWRRDLWRALVLLVLAGPVLPAQEISGELRQWHDVVLTFRGPATSEDAEPNPFLHYRLNVTFEKGPRRLVVPGYFAADGDAAETSATSGDRWRVHFVPEETGEWAYRVSFRQGPDVAVAEAEDAGTPVGPDGLRGTLTIAPSDKTGRDHRARGLLRYAGEHYARYQGSGEFFIQVGAQSPENLLAYADFDGTVDHGGAPNTLKDGLHHYQAHVRDWRPGDPTWKDGRGKGLVGALNYLAGKGMNTVYSLTMNVGGDGREIYPWASYDQRARYDVSKLAQWEIVLSHMDRLGLQLMVITQEEENEQILGKLTTLRKLYYRELIARLAHHHALLWDLSEEMDRWRYYSTEDIQELCRYFKRLDPYQHPIQYVQWKGELLPDEKGYGRLLGFPHFDGTALQHDPEFTHQATRKWVELSAAAGHKWLVGVIEINPTSSGVVPDADDYWHDAVRKHSLWGNLMAGGSGTVFFFGYAYPNSDLDMEDWRSRDHFWDLLRYAHEFFTRFLPFHEMGPADELTPDPRDFVFAKRNAVYAVYLPDGGTARLDLTEEAGTFDVQWYDPRSGGELQDGTVRTVIGGGLRALGDAPRDRARDWAVLVRQQPGSAPAARTSGSAFTRETRVLVKLRTPVSTARSRHGDRVEASIISPESYLGGALEGTVEEATTTPGGRITLRFHTLRFGHEQLTLGAGVVGFVNSKGRPGVDDAGRPTRVERGEVVSDGPDILLDEGAELRLLASPGR